MLVRLGYLAETHCHNEDERCRELGFRFATRLLLLAAAGTLTG